MSNNLTVTLPAPIPVESPAVTSTPAESSPSKPVKTPKPPPRITRDRKFLTLREKLKIIADAEETGAGSRKLAAKYHVGKTQIAEILRRKAEIRQELIETRNADKKRKSPKTDFTELNKQVLAWYHQALAQNVPVSGPVIKEKAKELAKQLNVNKFHASNGWLYRFRKRNKILCSAELRNTYPLSILQQ